MDYRGVILALRFLISRWKFQCDSDKIPLSRSAEPSHINMLRQCEVMPCVCLSVQVFVHHSKNQPLFSLTFLTKINF